MGICMSNGVIRDFAGPYFVSEDLMAFGNPTKYWQLSPSKAVNATAGWDSAVRDASEVYKKRMVRIQYIFITYITYSYCSQLENTIPSMFVNPGIAVFFLYVVLGSNL